MVHGGQRIPSDILAIRELILFIELKSHLRMAFIFLGNCADDKRFPFLFLLKNKA